ncbi:MAG: hypothetical protein R2698_14250 [Microthrixaceae bacterium]
MTGRTGYSSPHAPGPGPQPSEGAGGGTGPTGSPHRSGAPDDHRRGSLEGALAAAALVLAAGALVFAVVAHLRANELRDQMLDLRHRVEAIGADPGPVGTTVPTEPEDPVAAAAAVRKAFQVVYDPSADMAQRLAPITDPKGVEVAMEQAARGPNAATMLAARVDIVQVEFASAKRDGRLHDRRPHRRRWRWHRAGGTDTRRLEGQPLLRVHRARRGRWSLYRLIRRPERDDPH